ncbi:hypothetical protein HYV85_01995 [Candidatus Woesearchaeota archaeon]|nr:hypothetical protein [Candidatus Woesearchaeota archaeon]
MANGFAGAGKKSAQDAPASASFNRGIAEVERRLRALEERYSTIERRSQVTEENMLSSDRKIRADIKMLNGEISELKGQAADMTDKIKALIRELEGFAKVEDVDVIRKYLNLIEPLGFVTQNEVERIVRQAVDEAIARQVSGEGSEKGQE